MFAVATRFLCDGHSYTEYQVFCNTMLCLHGIGKLIYNVHCLLHLSNQILTHGMLNDFSCFLFEHHLGYMKRLLKSKSNALLQVVRRLNEKSFYSNQINNQIIYYSQHCNDPLTLYLVVVLSSRKLYTVILH